MISGNYFSLNCAFSQFALGLLLFVLDTVFHIGSFPQIFGDPRLSAHIYKQALNADSRLCVGRLGFFMEGFAVGPSGRAQTVLLWNAQLSHYLDVSFLGLITFPSDTSCKVLSDRLNPLDISA